jgi:inner membrane protein
MHPGSLRCSSLAYRTGTRRSSRLAIRAPRRSRCSHDFGAETLVRLDNLTHSLMGAALAELAGGAHGSSAALRNTPPRNERRLFLATGVLVSNLPDFDLLYTGVTPEPLGYLLHHRGHTHTVAGLIAQALLIAAVCLTPPLRRAIRDAGGRRFAALVAASLGGHLVLDSWNTYGIHPFHPIDSRWYYGDAVFIFEPWLWLLFGTAAAANARSRRGGIAVAVVVSALCAALAYAGILPVAALACLLACGAGLGWWARAASPRARAAVALAGSALLIAGLFGLSALARARTRAMIGLVPRGAILDVVVNPNPGWPLCWAVIVMEKDARADELVLRRGTLSLLPGWYPPGRCPMHRIAGLLAAADGEALAWGGELRQPVGELRDLARRDCWVRAWLQFGRAPFVRDGTIADLRFETARGNFTTMALPGEDRACPPAMTSWAMPRADVLAIP